MSLTILNIIIAALLICLILASVAFYKSPSWALAMLLPLIAWFILDTTIFAMGNLLGEGSLLQVLSHLRVLLRVLATPLLIVVALDQAKRFGSKLLADPLLLLGSWIVIVVLMIVGFVLEFVGRDLELQDIDGLKRYVAIGSSTVHYPAILTAVIVVYMGWYAFRKTYWLLAGGGALLAAYVIAIFTSAAWLVPAAHVALCIAFLLTERSLRPADQ